MLARTERILVDTQAKLDRLCAALIGAVSLDIETNGLYPYDPEARIVMLGFGTPGATWHIPFHHPESPWSPRQLEAIVRKLDRCMPYVELILQNGKFDLLWLRAHYHVTWQASFDIMLAHYLLDENSPHDLEYIAHEYLETPPWDIPLKEKQGGAPLTRIMQYHSLDLHYSLMLYPILQEKLNTDKDLPKVFKHLLMPCANLFIEIEHNGLYIDAPRFAAAETHLRQALEAASQALQEFGDINWSSPKQIARRLYDEIGLRCRTPTPKGARSTGINALKQIDHPVATALLKYRAIKQQLSFFVEGWKPYLTKDSRLHPSFKLHGTVTGRLSSSNPNCQQIPRDARIRSLITAPPTHALVECDLSQIEMRIAAELSSDKHLHHAFTHDIDVHWQTAIREINRGREAAREQGLIQLVFHTAKISTGNDSLDFDRSIEELIRIGPHAAAEIDAEWSELRKKAKVVGFGYLFGMGAKRFKDYARTQYDMHLTDAECASSRQAFFDLYASLSAWHERQRRFVTSTGYVRSLTGRKRRLPEAQHDTPHRSEALRQAINSPVQSFASDLNLMVLLQIHREFPEVELCATIHDAILARVPLSLVRTYVWRVDEIMRSPDLLDTFGIRLKVPLAGEVKIGPWGSGVSPEKWRKGP